MYYKKFEKYYIIHTYIESLFEKNYLQTANYLITENN